MNEYVNRTINFAFCAKPLKEEEKRFIANGYTDENKDALILVATKKKVLPVIGKLMIKLNIDKVFWEEQYNYFKNRNLEVTNLVAEVFKEFKKNGIEHICVFENYGAMLASNTDIALYSSGDIDLYGGLEQKEKIITVIESFGYKLTQDESNERNIISEFLKDNGIIRINVAWKPLRRSLLPVKACTEKYIKWDEMVYYKDTYIRIPNREILLYLCFLRIAIHGYSRSPDIRLYIDTFNVAYNNPNWEQVIEWAKCDGVITKFVTVAAIAHDLIKLDVPEVVLELSKKDKFSQKILALTYDFTRHTLQYDPSGINLLKVEAASDNRRTITEIIKLLFPPKEWIKEYYENKGENIFKAYCRYYKRLF